MNKIAKDLNLKQTCFCNPHGLVNKFNKSNAFEISLLSQEAIKSPFILKIINSKVHIG